MVIDPNAVIEYLDLRNKLRDLHNVSKSGWIHSSEWAITERMYDLWVNSITNPEREDLERSALNT